MKNIIANIQHIDRLGIYPHVTEIDTIDGTRAVLAGGRAIDLFGSNDYLGLSQRQEVVAIAQRGLEELGLGARAARMACGTFAVHARFERELAKFLGKEDSVTFASGLQTNFTIISAICNLLQMDKERSFIQPITCFVDQLAHASVHDGIRAANVPSKVFPHSNMRALKTCLERCSTPRKMVLLDGLYGSEADLAPLAEILDVAERFDAIVYVDDAHGVGTIGEQLGGVADHFNVAHHPNLIIAGTFSKAFGGIGGFVAGSSDFCRLMRVAARANLFSHALPPHMVSSYVEILRIIREEGDSLKKALRTNIAKAREGLQALGFRLLGGALIPIVPVMIGDEMESVYFSDDLLNEGIMAPPFRYPATPRGQARVRLTITAIHQDDQIEHLIDAFRTIGKRRGQIC